MPAETQTVFLEALGWTILNSWWQWGVLWMLFLVLKKSLFRLSAAHRYNLALGLLLSGLLWSAGTFIFRWYHPTGYHLAGISSDRVFLEYSRCLVYIQMALPYLSVLYLAWLTVRVIRFSQLYFSANRLRKEGLHKVPVEWRLFLEEMRGHMHISRKVTLWFSQKIESPVLLGWLKPMILLPFSAATQLSHDQLEAILIHELAHIRRNDYFWNLVVSLAEVLLYYNPFTHKLVAIIREERENACDDWVLQFPFRPESYASALLQLEQQRVFPGAGFLVAAGGSSSKLLLARVKRMLALPADRREPIGKLALLTTAIALAGLFALVEPRQEISRVLWRTVEEPLEYTFTRTSSPEPENPAPVNNKQARPLDTGNTLAPPSQKSVASAPERAPGINSPGQESPEALALASELLAVNDQIATMNIHTTWTTAIDDNEEEPAATLAGTQKELNFVLPSKEMHLPADARTNLYTPYVPLNSFKTYEITLDTVKRKEGAGAAGAVKLSDKAMNAALQVQVALNQLNWDKLKLRLEEEGASAADIQYTLEKELAKLDWEKVEKEAARLRSLCIKTEQETRKAERALRQTAVAPAPENYPARPATQSRKRKQTVYF